MTRKPYSSEKSNTLLLEDDQEGPKHVVVRENKRRQN
jgi:hypothetical protein